MCMFVVTWPSKLKITNTKLFLWQCPKIMDKLYVELETIFWQMFFSVWIHFNYKWISFVTIHIHPPPRIRNWFSTKVGFGTVLNCVFLRYVLSWWQNSQLQIFFSSLFGYLCYLLHRSGPTYKLLKPSSVIFIIFERYPKWRKDGTKSNNFKHKKLNSK